MFYVQFNKIFFNLFDYVSDKDAQLEIKEYEYLLNEK